MNPWVMHCMMGKEKSGSAEWGERRYIRHTNKWWQSHDNAMRLVFLLPTFPTICNLLSRSNFRDLMNFQYEETAIKITKKLLGFSFFFSLLNTKYLFSATSHNKALFSQWDAKARGLWQVKTKQNKKQTLHLSKVVWCFYFTGFSGGFSDECPECPIKLTPKKGYRCLQVLPILKTFAIIGIKMII